jgi:prepilin-type N-terminal cleavage/methylation domain-containing protein
MDHRGLTLFEVVVTIVVVGLLACLLVPSFVCGRGPARRTACASNLRHLYQAGLLYSSTHRGAWPAATGSALWLAFVRTSPPLIGPDELDVLSCPVRGEGEPGRCDYLGPRKPASGLKPGDALAADRPGNHGEGEAGNVLLKDGTARDFEVSPPSLETLSE